MIERNSYTKVQKFIFPPRWNFVRNLLFREGSQKWAGNIERSTHATNYAALTALPRPFTTSTRLRPTSAFSGSEIGLGHCTPKTLTTPLLEQHNAYRGGKTTLCGTRGEIAFMANRSRALLWTVVVIV